MQPGAETAALAAADQRNTGSLRQETNSQPQQKQQKQQKQQRHQKLQQQLLANHCMSCFSFSAARAVTWHCKNPVVSL